VWGRDGPGLTQGNLANVYKYLMGGNEKREPGSFPWSPVTGQEATGTNWNMKFHLNIKKKCYY